MNKNFAYAAALTLTAALFSIRANAQPSSDAETFYKTYYALTEAGKYSDALIELMPRVAAGDVVAKHELALMYSNGSGVTRDYQKAFDLEREAAKELYPRAISNLGSFYINGQGVAVDLTEGERLTLLAIETSKNNPRVWPGRTFNVGRAMNNLGFLNETRARSLAAGAAQENAFRKALEWYQKASSADYGDAYVSQGRFIENGWGVKKDLGLAGAMYKNAAEAGSVQGQQIYGQMLMAGTYGETKDLQKALQWTKKSADSGDITAINQLGDIYYNRRNEGLKNLEKSVEYYRLAAEKGNANAQFSLGFAYARGKGVSPNGANAVDWLKKASMQGVAAADEELGYLTWDGVLVQRDSKIAIAWFKKAAQAGNVRAQNKLGAIYHDGEGGIPVNYTEAQAWFEKAAANGSDDAKINLGMMKRNNQLSSAGREGISATSRAAAKAEDLVNGTSSAPSNLLEVAPSKKNVQLMDVLGNWNLTRIEAKNIEGLEQIGAGNRFRWRHEFSFTGTPANLIFHFNPFREDGKLQRICQFSVEKFGPESDPKRFMSTVSRAFDSLQKAYGEPSFSEGRVYGFGDLSEVAGKKDYPIRKWPIVTRSTNEIFNDAFLEISGRSSFHISAFWRGSRDSVLGKVDTYFEALKLQDSSDLANLPWPELQTMGPVVRVCQSPAATTAPTFSPDSKGPDVWTVDKSLSGSFLLILDHPDHAGDYEVFQNGGMNKEALKKVIACRVEPGDKVKLLRLSKSEDHSLVVKVVSGSSSGCVGDLRSQALEIESGYVNPVSYCTTSLCR